MAKLDSYAFAKVKDIERCAGILYGSAYALDDIVDVGKIASCSAIAVKIYWLLVIDEVGEFVYSQVGT